MNSLKDSRLTRFLNSCLSFAWFGVWVLLVFFIIAIASFKIVPDAPISLRIDDDQAGILHLGDKDYEIAVAEAGGELIIKDAPAWTVLLYSFFGLINFAVSLTIIFFLRKIFQTVRQGEPFDLLNGKRIKNIGLVLVAGYALEILRYYLTFVFLSVNIDHASFNIVANPPIKLTTVFLILLIFILGHIFSVAAEMREEQKMMV